MTTNESDPKERIARDLGWESFDAAPRPVQRHIEDRAIDIDDPFAMLEGP